MCSNILQAVLTQRQLGQKPKGPGQAKSVCINKRKNARTNKQTEKQANNGPRSLKSSSVVAALGGPKTFWEDQRAWRPKNFSKASQRAEGTKVLRRQTTGGTKNM